MPFVIRWVTLRYPNLHIYLSASPQDIFCLPRCSPHGASYADCNIWTIAAMTRAHACALSTTNSETSRLWFAVNSLPGRAKLVTRNEPDRKSPSDSASARGSPYGIARNLAKIQSSRPASATTTAGRSLDCDKSENGNGTRTIEPTEGARRGDAYGLR